MASKIDDMPRKCLMLDFFRWHWRGLFLQVLPWLGLSVPSSSKLVSTLENTLNWIQRGQSRFLCSCFFLVSFVDLQMHIVIIFVLITSVVVYFCGRLPADPKYLDVLKTRVHSILCHLLNLITDYYFGSSALQLLGQSQCRRLKLLGEQELWPALPCQKLEEQLLPLLPLFQRPCLQCTKIVSVLRKKCIRAKHAGRLRRNTERSPSITEWSYSRESRNLMYRSVSQHSMAHPRKPPYRRKNFAKISYASRVIANFVPNFVAIATGAGRGKMQLAAFDGTFPKIPL